MKRARSEQDEVEKQEREEKKPNCAAEATPEKDKDAADDDFVPQDNAEGEDEYDKSFEEADGALNTF